MFSLWFEPHKKNRTKQKKILLSYMENIGAAQIHGNFQATGHIVHHERSYNIDTDCGLYRYLVNGFLLVIVLYL